MLKKIKKKAVKKATKKPAKKPAAKKPPCAKPACRQGRASVGKPTPVKLPAVNIEINQDWCKACYICVDICPKAVFGKSTKVSKLGVYPAKVERPSQCIVCRECENHCPDLAISVGHGV